MELGIVKVSSLKAGAEKVLDKWNRSNIPGLTGDYFHKTNLVFLGCYMEDIKQSAFYAVKFQSSQNETLYLIIKNRYEVPEPCEIVTEECINFMSAYFEDGEGKVEELKSKEMEKTIKKVNEKLDRKKANTAIQKIDRTDLKDIDQEEYKPSSPSLKLVSLIESMTAQELAKMIYEKTGPEYEEAAVKMRNEFLDSFSKFKAFYKAYEFYFRTFDTDTSGERIAVDYGNRGPFARFRLYGSASGRLETDKLSLTEFRNYKVEAIEDRLTTIAYMRDESIKGAIATDLLPENTNVGDIIYIVYKLGTNKIEKVVKTFEEI